MTSFSEPETTSHPVKDVKSDQHEPLSTKRKPEPITVDEDNSFYEINDTKKKPNLGVPSRGESDSSNIVGGDIKNIIDAENGHLEDEEEDNDFHESVLEDSEDEDDYEDDDEEEDDSNEDEEDYNDHVNGATKVVDLKGKGIMKDEKGKGKLVEESEDSSDYASESNSDSDLSDDPLTEVDLDNILPTRTRRRTIQPGLKILNSPSTREDEDNGSERKS